MKQNLLILLIALSLGTVQTTKSMDACTTWHLLQIATGATGGVAITKFLIDSWNGKNTSEKPSMQKQPRIRLAPEYQPPQRSQKSLIAICCKAISLRAMAQAWLLAAGAIASYTTINAGFEGLITSICD